MPFSAGDAVLVLALARKGRVVEPRGRGYRVEVGGLTISCREDELRRVDPPQGSKRKRRAHAESTPPAAAPRTDARPGRASSSLDLHGYTVADAREALLRHLDTALLAGDEVVEIVHGIGTGKVRAAVLQELKRIEAVKHVRPHPTNRGSTLVYL